MSSSRDVGGAKEAVTLEGRAAIEEVIKSGYRVGAWSGDTDQRGNPKWTEVRICLAAAGW